MNEDGYFWIIGAALVFGAIYYFNKDDEPEIVAPAPIIAPTISTLASPIRLTEDITISTLENGTVWRLDVSSMSGERKARNAWMVEDHTNDKTTPHRTTKTLYVVNCESSSYQVPTSIAYSPEGEASILWEEPLEDAKVNYTVPDSRIGNFASIVCAKNFD